ncbi:YdcH family protein [Acidovorax carolinensis]
MIDLRIAHADLDARIDQGTLQGMPDDFLVRRLKKRRLALRDEIDRLERALQPQEPA